MFLCYVECWELISIKIRFLEFFEVALEFNWPKTMGSPANDDTL